MVDSSIIDKINRVPIFDIMNVKGYCVYIEGVLRTFVFAQDIAREAGLIQINNKNYTSTSGRIETSYVSLKWDRFNHYVNMSIESFKRINPSILPLIQLPINSNSYMPCELALVVLMHCKSKKALDFQVKLATLIMPKIQQDTIDFYEKEIDKYKEYINLRHEDINSFIEELKYLVYNGQIPYLVNYIKDLQYLNTEDYMKIQGDHNG